MKLGIPSVAPALSEAKGRDLFLIRKDPSAYGLGMTRRKRGVSILAELALDQGR
jgi:hypothetical protein